jgi:predicted Zn-dependent protease
VAAEAYQRGLALAPGNLQARYNLAGARLAAGDEEGAAAGFREVLAAEASHLGALNNLAWILATTRRPAIADRAEAVRLAERAAEATEGAPEVLETLAVAYAAAGRRAEARATAERAVVAARRAGAAELARRLEERLAEWAA